MNKKVFIVLLLLLFINPIKSFSVINQSYCDELDTTLYVEHFTYLSALAARNIDSLIICSENLLKNSLEVNFRAGKEEAYIKLGYAYYHLGNIDDALKYFNQASSLSKKFNDSKIMLICEIWLGECFLKCSDYEKATLHLIAAEKLAHLFKSNEDIIKIYQTKAALYRAMKDYHTSLQYCNLILKNFADDLTPFEKYRVNLHMANVYFDQKKYDLALVYFKQAREFAVTLNQPKFLALVDQNIGNIYLSLGELSMAEEYIFRSLKIFTEIKDYANIELSYRIRASIAFERGDFKNSLEHFNSALSIALQMRNLQAIIANYHNLATVYHELFKVVKRPALSNKMYHNLQQELIYKDSLYKTEKLKSLHELEKKYETEKKDNQITLLEKETEIQRSRQIYMIIGIIGLTVIVFFMVFIYRYTRKINKVLALQKDQIAIQNKQLENAINTQNKLFSIIAHDLRSPLASISNISVLVKNYFEQKDYHAADQMVSKLEMRNKQVLQLVDNLLSWAMSQTGKIEYIPDNQSLEKILYETLNECEELFNQKKIKLKFEVKEGVRVFVDRITIKTVFRNLVNNAIKFSHEGGLIVVTTHEENNTAVVTITDSGTGISEEIQPLLFEVDNKKQKPGTHGEKSSGLGLVICKEFVERNKGRIWFTSKEGEGSTFYVSFPMNG